MIKYNAKLRKGTKYNAKYKKGDRGTWGTFGGHCPAGVRGTWGTQGLYI